MVSADLGAPPALAAHVKLVIWDLDEVFWQGTLSEGPIVMSAENAEIVRELNRRGIVNSICSKNDAEAVRERLAAEGLSDQFVFASASWTPKGRRVADLIAHAQLRAENVLFIDDNPQNLQEALYFAPGLQIAYPSILPGLLAAPQLKGKDDRGLTRLAQYRILERKFQDRVESASSNAEFLRSCDIRVELRSPQEGDVERLVELANRTNQLNYTKRRLTSEELREMLADPACEVVEVAVADRYGDYGICGLYALSSGRLSDFIFSCRILDMGVEKWIYERLGRPALEISGDVATPLVDTDDVDWITTGTAPTVERRAVTSGSVLLKGGCDLTPVHDFLGGATKVEFSYNGASGANVQGHHTEILRRAFPETLDAHGDIIDRLPFLDRDAFRSRLISEPEAFSSIVYSALMDYTQGLYRLRDSDFVVPQGQFTEDITNPEIWPDIERRYGDVGFDRRFLVWFAERFTFEGALSAAALEQNLRWLASRLPSSCRLVLLNGAEVDLPNPYEGDRYLHHREMNAVLDSLAGELDNVVVVDVRELVRSQDDLLDNIRHYPRRVHMAMAEAIRAAVSAELSVDTSPLVYRTRHVSRRLVRGGARRARRLARRVSQRSA